MDAALPDPSTTPDGEPTRVDVIVIGSGFSGLGMAAALKRDGRRSFVVLEKADDLGGTWRDNRYPGCACDIPSALYSFSFAPNPEWTRAFSPQPEILAYLHKVADDHGLRPYLRFGAEVAEAVWDDAAGLWRLTTRDGRRWAAPVVVAGQGALHRPALPAIPGLESFTGTAFHSARWPERIDLAGKRVAVIGTGASAIQIVPEIAPVAGRLTLFQRTPAWIIPKPDRPIHEAARIRYARQPWRQVFWRFWIWTALELIGRSRFNPTLAGKTEARARGHLEAQVADPALRAKLTPDYVLGCKRVLISNDFYPALTRDNVDLETTAIDRIEGGDIVLADGRRIAADVIVFGTGFVVTDPASEPMEVIGRDGVRLKDAWREGSQAHLGITVAGFPNWFLLMGPNTGLGHNSMIYMIESQIAFVMAALKTMDGRGLTRLEPRPEAQAAFLAEVDDKVARSVWGPGRCQSWYQGDKTRNTTVWPDYTWRYRARTRRLDLADYDAR